MRVRYKINQDQMVMLDEERLRAIGKEALSFKLSPEILPSHQRARLPQLTESAVLSPLSAVETYLTEVAPDKKDRLLGKAKEIMGRVQAELAEGS